MVAERRVAARFRRPDAQGNFSPPVQKPQQLAVDRIDLGSRIVDRPFAHDFSLYCHKSLDRRKPFVETRLTPVDGGGGENGC
jgi:hypothetical protein